MEPLSTNSSDRTHVDDVEMQSVAPTSPAPTIQPGLATGRARVRFNNSTAEIPPSPERVSYSRVGTDITRNDEYTTDAEDVLDACNTHHIDDNNLSSDVRYDESYAVTGSSQGGVFYQLLQAYKKPVPALNDTPSEASSTAAASPAVRPGSASGTATPSRRKWYDVDKDTTLSTLIGASTKLANPTENKGTIPTRHHHKRSSSAGIIGKVLKAKDDRDARIKIHVAAILKRQQYIIRMCRALMLFGAPTHRLEEYLAATAKVLDINSQFLYIPGCMIISFDDVLTHTAEVKIVRTAQGVNLGKLKDTHEIYKEVLHDVISLDEALSRLEEVINAKDRHPVWLNVLMYGLASAAVSVFFKARLIDMGPIFVLGTLLGVLQLVVSPLSKTYSTVFEISATILMSFIARALGSINNGGMFCFSAIAQSSIALILPGWVCIPIATRPGHIILTQTACSELSPRAPVPRYRTGLYPTRLRHHILALPWLWHHRRHSHLRSH
jgi:uncharacterized membrane protein YjjP (DUF1212 family)